MAVNHPDLGLYSLRVFIWWVTFTLNVYGRLQNRVHNLSDEFNIFVETFIINK
jgi:hypothetical protein